MKKQDLSNLLFLFKAIYRQERTTFYIGMLLAVIKAVNPYILTLLMGLVIDVTLQGTNIKSIVYIIAAAISIKLILGIAESRLRESFNIKLANYPKEFGSRELNKKALTMDYEYLEDAHVQDIRFRAFQNSFYGVGGWLMVQLAEFVEIAAGIGIALVIVLPMFKTPEGTSYRFLGSGWNTLIIFAILGIMFFVNSGFSFKNTKKAMDHFFNDSSIYNKKLFYLDMLSGVEPQKDIRVMGFGGSILRDIDDLFRKIQDSEKSRNAIYIRRTMLNIFVLSLSSLVIYVYAGLQAYLGIITIGSVVTYASSMDIFTRSVNRLGVNMGHIKTAAGYAADYKEFLELEKRKYEGTIPLEKRRDHKFSVEFEHVSFKYPGSDNYVIRDLNFKFVIGRKMAIVGKNGSGKTTFIKLLCRLYDVTEGCIKINGIDIRKYDHAEYCNLFSVVFQDFQMFAFPVGENVAAGAAIDREKVLDAINKVDLGDRIVSLSNGLDTCIGKDIEEGGVAFSGGEKQKLAIARAIYKDAPFVIMDEPTAALDPEAEAEVFEGFDRMVGNKTAIYISHRLASCKFCEDLLVFDSGRLVQHGTHNELQREEGLYRELWSAQAQYYA